MATTTSVTERDMSMLAPGYSRSADFNTEFLEYVPDNRKSYYSPGDTITIAPFRNVTKAQLCDPERTFLAFDVFMRYNKGSGGPSTIDPTTPFRNLDIDQLNIPRWGAPFLSQVSCDLLTNGGADITACPPSCSADEWQMYYTSRLLAAGVQASGDTGPAREKTLSLPGKHKLAGGYSAYERAFCVSGQVQTAVYDTDKTDIDFVGGLLPYAVPMSALCTLFNQSSCLLPIGMISSGGDVMRLSFTIPELEDIVGTSKLPATTVSSMEFRLYNPRVVSTVIRVNTPKYLSYLGSLYNGELSHGGGTPLPLVVGHKQFIYAKSTILGKGSKLFNSMSPFNLTFSNVRHPSVEAIVLRFFYRKNSSVQFLKTQRERVGAMALGGNEPNIVFTDLQARINDLVIPLQSISDTIDLQVSTATAEDGDSARTVKTASRGGVGSSVYYDLARRGFALYESDAASTSGASLADVVSSSSVTSFGETQVVSSITAVGPAYRTSVAAPLVGRSTGSLTSWFAPPGTAGAPNKNFASPISTVVIPLASLPRTTDDPEFRTDRGWDLRAISHFGVSASIAEIDYTATDVTKGRVFYPPLYDVECQGFLVCNGAARFSSSSTDPSYIFTAARNADM